jgi:glycosyltransferase involved in cell wall biosynthesis
VKSSSDTVRESADLRRQHEKTRLRVAFLIPALDLSGAERMVLRIAAGLDPERFEPVVVGFVRGTGFLEPHLTKAAIRHAVMARPATPRVALPIACLAWLRRNRPEVLLTFMFHANMVGRLARSVGLVPALVCSERVVGFHSRARVALNRWTAGVADVITTNSTAGQRFWANSLGLDPGSIQVIYNGVDADEFSPAAINPEEPRIGVLAQLQDRNGHLWLLEAMQVLDRALPIPWTCELAGIGPAEPAIRAQIEARRLQHRVRLLGHVQDAPMFLRSLQVTVHPAFVSGMPNAVLESMAAAVPPIATAVGGTPETIEDGRSGFLVRPGDVTRTVDRLTYLLTNRNERLAMGVAARERIIARFSTEAAIRQTEQIISDLTSA